MKCKFCRNQIEEGAKVCPTCKHYQSWWLNALPYLGGLVALLAIGGTASFYAADKWHTLQATNTGSIGLSVLGVKSDGDIVVHNTGERDIFVSSIIFDSPTWREAVSLNHVVQGGHLESIECKLTGRDGQKWRCITNPLAKEILAEKVRVKNQEWHWYDADNPELSAHFNLADHAICDGTAKVFFRPFGDSKALSQTIKCKVLIVQRADNNGDFSEEPITSNEADQGRQEHPRPLNRTRNRR